MSGGLTDTPLSELGRQQAECVARRLHAGVDFSVIYSSPLQRAALVAQSLAAAAGDRLALHFRPGLREILCGEADGLKISDIKKRFPEQWCANLRQNDPDFRWPGGESYQEFRQRCLEELRNIAAAHSGERVLVVTHTGLISQVVGSLFGTSPARWSLYRPGNASVTEIDWGPEHRRLVCFDDRTHLSSLCHPAESAA